MKKLKVAVALACVMTALLAISASAMPNQASNAQKTYATGPVMLYNDGSPAI